MLFTVNELYSLYRQGNYDCTWKEYLLHVLLDTKAKRNDCIIIGIDIDRTINSLLKNGVKANVI